MIEYSWFNGKHTKRRLQHGNIHFCPIDQWYYYDDGDSLRYVEWKHEPETAAMHQRVGGKGFQRLSAPGRYYMAFDGTMLKRGWGEEPEAAPMHQSCEDFPFPVIWYKVPTTQHRIGEKMGKETVAEPVTPTGSPATIGDLDKMTGDDKSENPYGGQNDDGKGVDHKE